MRIRPLIVGLTAALSCAATALADTIVLKDGTVLTGVVKQVKDGYEITSAAGQSSFVPKADVKSIKLSNEGKVTEQSAKERLASLRRSVEAETQIDRVLDRYKQFIEMNKDTDAAADAQKDIALWQDRRAKGMVKVGSHWLTPAQRDEYLIATAKLANEIADQIAGGDIAGATKRIAQGLEEDPTNVSLAYLDGVLQLRRNRLSEAKRSFDLVVDQIPTHPPTLYNEAAIAAYFKRWPAAIPMFEKVMTLAPNHPEILNGVTEFIRLLPDSHKRSAAFDRLQALYTAQERVVEAEMAKKGMFRFGSGWAPKDKIDELNKKIAEFEEKKKSLQADFDASLDKIKQYQREIDRIEQQLTDIEYNRIVRDATTGRTYYMPRPQIYYDLLEEKSRYERQIQTAKTEGEDLKRKAKELETQAPQMPYAGSVMPVGEAGVPIVLPAGANLPGEPTTAPATQPSMPIHSDRPPLPLWPPEATTTQPAN